MLSLLRNLEFRRVLGPVAAGTSTQTTDAVNTSGVQTVLFVVGLGTLTATNVTTMTLRGSDDDVTYADMQDESNTDQAVTIYDTENNKLVLVEVVKPKQKYVKLQIARATANAVIDLVIAILGVWHRTLPVTQDTTHVSHYGNLSAISPDLE